MKAKLTTLCLFSLLLISCNDEPQIGYVARQEVILSEISDQAKAYLDEILDIMEHNSINKYKINWIDFRKEVFNAVPTAQTIDHTYPGIYIALKLLGDNHSMYITPNNVAIGYSSLTFQIENIETPVIPDDIGYVKVASYTGTADDASAIAFTNQIQNQIKQQDHSDLKGWIVDLRNNTGGNMWPMLAGIGPILGEGVAGYFIYPYPDNKPAVSWNFQDGEGAFAQSNNDRSVRTPLNNSYNLLVPKPKVAVLLNSAVASSGEVIAISFIGRENTKSFGSATIGLSTCNSSFQLSDNATLILTTAYLADRNKKIYGVPINPDQISSSRTIINDAITWIRE